MFAVWAGRVRADVALCRARERAEGVPDSVASKSTVWALQDVSLAVVDLVEALGAIAEPFLVRLIERMMMKKP
jgi:hypothetical protein